MKVTATAIDFGSSKIVTVVGASGGYQRADIIGYGETSYDGFINGKFNDPSNLGVAISASVAQAEQSSGQQISEAYIGVPGDFIRVITRDVELALSETRRIVDDDVDRVLENASKGLVIPGGEIIHRNPAYFSVDDGPPTMSPVNQKGEKLSARVCFIAVDQGFIDEISNILSRQNIRTLGFMSTSLGQAMLLLTPDERDSQSLLVDIGYLTTEVIALQGDAIIHHAIVPAGGAMMTVDLVYGLKLPMAAAEEVKRAYIFGMNSGPNIEVRDTSGSYSFPREEVARVLEPRAEEISEHVTAAIARMGLQYGPRSGYYLSGGGFSLMRGGREFVSNIIGKPMRVVDLHSAQLNSPVYASTLGLIDMVFDSIERNTDMGIVWKVGNFFRELFGR